MKNSLVLRQVLVICGITVSALAVMAWLVHRSTSARFQHEIEAISGRPPAATGPLIDALQSSLTSGGEDQMCRFIADGAGRGTESAVQLLVVRRDLSVACATSPDLLDASVSMEANDQLRVAATAGSSLLELVATRPPELWESADRHFGWLLTLESPLRVESGNVFAWEVWRDAGLWLVLVAGAAIAATVLIMRRSLRPMTQLIDAAQKIRNGEVPDELPQNSKIREFEQLFATFKAAAQSIADLERMRRHLISDISHELRTPVTNIKVQLEAIGTGLIKADDDFVRTLEGETRLLERLVQDFQQLAVSDAGQLRLSLQPLPLCDTLNNILEPMVEGAGAQLDNRVAPDIFVIADEERLRQVFGNLFENSVRHQPSDLRLRLSATRSDDSVDFVFEDNGPGIAEHDRAFVFERFYRAEKSRNRATGGAGLGLTIVKALVEAMNGTVRLSQSTLGGASFMITLPDGSKDLSFR